MVLKQLTQVFFEFFSLIIIIIILASLLFFNLLFMYVGVD